MTSLIGNLLKWLVKIPPIKFEHGHLRSNLFYSLKMLLSSRLRIASHLREYKGYPLPFKLL